MDGRQFAPCDDKVPADGGGVSLNLPRMAGAGRKVGTAFWHGPTRSGQRTGLCKNQRSPQPGALREIPRDVVEMIALTVDCACCHGEWSVSYTHLTLPTNREV